MSNVVFAHTRYGYDSYSDYRRLVELSGYPTCYVDEIDPYDATKCYICTPLNGEWNQGWPRATARIIHWDLEWRLEGEYPVIPGVEEVWASDRWYANRIGARYVLFGSHQKLALSEFTRFDTIEYDLAPMAYIYGRREHKINELRNAGYRIAPNAWGDERDRILRRSLAFLHIHQLPGVYTVAPGRFALAAAYRLPLLAESVTDPADFKDRVIWASYDEIVQRAYNIASEPNDLTYGYALHDFLCVDRTFKKEVEAAL